MSFAIRADILGPLEKQFGLTNEQIGFVNLAAFWGFPVAMLIGGPLCDVVGMGRLLTFAFIGHLVAIIVTIMAHSFTMLFLGTLATLQQSSAPSGILAAHIAAPVPTVYGRVRRQRRLRKLQRQLPGAFDLMARVIRAGQTMAQAIQAVADEFSPPIAAVQISICPRVIGPTGSSRLSRYFQALTSCRYCSRDISVP